ncbi:MAG: hypothetical protein Q9180_009392, partial [Flavoplaca navasiana]
HKAGNNENDHGNGRERNDDLLIIGSLHDSLLPLLTAPTDRFKERRVLPRPSNGIDSNDNTGKEANDIIDTTGRGVLGSIGSPIIKYLILPSPSPSPSPSTITTTSPHKPSSTFILPPGYTYYELEPKDLETCVRRTDIPRTAATLATWRNACVRYNGEGKGEELIAWVFISSDGSLSSLFVEPCHRGKGIARAVVRRLIVMSSVVVQEGDTLEEERGEGWVSSDVYLDNKGGRGVAMGVGGKEAWVCRWVGCDLARVREVWLLEESKAEGEGR